MARRSGLSNAWPDGLNSAPHTSTSDWSARTNRCVMAFCELQQWDVYPLLHSLPLQPTNQRCPELPCEAKQLYFTCTADNPETQPITATHDKIINSKTSTQQQLVTKSLTAIPRHNNNSVNIINSYTLRKQPLVTKSLTVTPRHNSSSWQYRNPFWKKKGLVVRKYLSCLINVSTNTEPWLVVRSSVHFLLSSLWFSSTRTIDRPLKCNY